MDTFVWKCESSTSTNVTARALEARFGDGYTQDTPNGRNNTQATWSVVVSAYGPVLRTIEDWLRAHAGVKFLWKPPRMDVQQVVCKSWSVSENGGAHATITMQFEQRYAP